jgi:hypothetical protein
MPAREKILNPLVQYNNDDSYTNINAVANYSDCPRQPSKKIIVRRSTTERRLSYHETSSDTQKDFSLFLQSLLVRLLFTGRQGICFYSGK